MGFLERILVAYILKSGKEGIVAFYDESNKAFSVPELLKRSLIDKEMSINDIARKSNIHRVTISRFLNGKADMHQTRLFRVIDAIGLEVLIR